MQPVWFFILSGKGFKEACFDSHWREAQQMQSVQLLIHSNERPENSHEKTQLGKTKPEYIYIDKISNQQMFSLFFTK